MIISPFQGQLRIQQWWADHSSILCSQGHDGSLELHQFCPEIVKTLFFNHISDYNERSMAFQATSNHKVCTNLKLLDLFEMIQHACCLPDFGVLLISHICVLYLSQLWSREVLQLLLLRLSFQQSSCTQHNCRTTGYEIGRFYYFSTVAGGGPDLTEIILAEIGIDFVVNYVAVIVKYEKLRMRAATPVHSFSSKATMFGQLA